MASSTSEDKTRFLRFELVIIDELTPILRDLLYHEIKPTDIFNKVIKRKLKNLRPEQWNVISSATTEGYKNFDITLLYTLLRNVCQNIPSPTTKWGVTQMPSQNEITVGDDIERIRLVRNKVVGHSSEAVISEKEYKDYMSIVSGICTRMQTLLNKDYTRMLQDTQECTIDSETERKYRGVIKHITDDFLLEKYLAENETKEENPVLDIDLDARKVDDFWKQYGASPLHLAAMFGNNTAVQSLLENNYDVNSLVEGGFSPVYVACQFGHEDVVQTLLSHGADVNLCSDHNYSPLHVACLEGHSNVVQVLIDKTTDINLRGTYGLSPLIAACTNGHEKTVEILLNNGAEINLSKENGFSPLHIACEKGCEGLVKLLLEKNAKVDQENNGGVRPLYIASNLGHANIVKLLVQSKANVNACTPLGYSPLLAACIKGRHDVVEVLLQHGADVNLPNEHGLSPLGVAIMYNHNSIVQLLRGKETH